MEMSAICSRPADRRNLSATLSLTFLLASLLLAAKGCTVHRYGNPTPYWDQWDAEAARLYKPWLEGELSIGHLLEPHNEHRILTTRVVHLALFEALGRRWDPVAQMYLNAAAHVWAVVLLLFFARSAVPPHLRWALWFFAAALFAVPFGWDSTLQGFNTHFYITLLGGLALLWNCLDGDFTLGKSASCLLLAALLVLTMASGSLAVLTAGGVLCLRRFALGDRRVPLLLLTLLAVAAAAGVVLTPHNPGHEHLKAQSLTQFATAFGSILAWPLAVDRVTPASLAAPLLMQLPLLLGVFATIGKTGARRSLLFLVALGGWFGLSALALGYGRAGDVLASRYLDMLCFGLLTNFAALLILWGRTSPRWRSGLVFLTALWLTIVTVSIYRNLPALQHDMRAKALASRIQERNVRGYLLTGGESWLQDADFLEIPYPSAERLRQLLDDKTIRGILPVSLSRPSSGAQPLRTEQPLLGQQGSIGPSGARLPSHLRPTRADHQLFEQLRPLPFSGETNSSGYPQRSGRKITPHLRRWPAGARLALRQGSLRSYPARARGGLSWRDLQYRRVERETQFGIGPRHLRFAGRAFAPGRRRQLRLADNIRQRPSGTRPPLCH
jgi:hypothetical protein